MKPNIFEWLAANVLNIVGGLSIGFSIPIGASVFGRELDMLIFLPVGIFLIGVSYYYKFVKYKS